MEFKKKRNISKTKKKVLIEEEEEEEILVQTKKAKFDKIGVQFKASGSAQSLVQNTATRTLDVDGNDGPVELVNESNDGTYKGLKNYTQFINKKASKITQSNAGSGLVAAGPLKGMTNVKIASRFDYAPAICKDYKETGFCGFGDSCVFMHDRGDYKQGWQLDLEWDEEQKRLAGENDPNSKYFKGYDEVEDQVESDDDLPFKCLICRNDFVDPIVTKCNHYFCEACALKHFVKSPSCFACNQKTNGVFNNAKAFKLKLEKKKERMALKEEMLKKKVEEGESDQEDDD